MNKYKINFAFQEAFEVEAGSMESAEDKIIEFIQRELDQLRDSSDCCSFALIENSPLDPDLKLI